jgi:rhamnogalacturonyl hydrolase YesR
MLILPRMLLRALSFPAIASLPLSVAAADMSREQIIAEGEKVADAQLAQLATKKPEIGWVSGVMWAGYADFSHVSAKGAYAAAVEQTGDKFHWTPRFQAKAPYHADDLCICQAFLDAYATKNDPARLGPSQSRIGAVSDYIEKVEAPYVAGAKDTRLTWWWCDALFMAPAGHARLSAITRDPRYLDAMDKEWWKTADLLYDKDEHLFYRDKSFLDKKTKNGKKVFWTRGNGWVFAGLARTLTYMPQDYPSRARYIAIFKEMAAKLASLQQADGTWRPSLLDPDEFPDSEISGTALDCYGFAWGINNGLLDRATYLPAAAKAWAAMMACLRPDGLPGYVQGVGSAPKAVAANGTQLYATGAFLMSVCELSKLAPFTVPPPPQLTASSVQPAGSPAN